MRIRILLASIALFYLLSLLYSGRAHAALDGSDSWGYYVHLPAFVLYHDTGDYSKSIAAWQANYPGKPDPRKDAYGIRPAPDGRFVVKYPIGTALSEVPFFTVAHLFSVLTGLYPADGFSAPYTWAVALSSLFFAVLGLFFAYKGLRFYFEEKISLVTTATIGIGTNLFFFIVYTPGMSHPLVFCLIAGLILLTKRWYENPGWKTAVALGTTLGLITLVRTQDVIAVVIPLLWGVRSRQDCLLRFRFLKEHFLYISLSVPAFVFTVLPQSVYWKFVSEKWWYDGYRGEYFDWLHPHIREGLLSFQNGWLIYTPVMLLAIGGFFYLQRYTRDLWLPILVFLPLHWLISYSWWCWMYINGFGSRPMVDTYALMAFPLAAWITVQKRFWMAISVLLAFVGLNIFQTWQTQQGIFWSERGNQAFYKASFAQTTGSEAALSAFESAEIQPVTGLQKAKNLAIQPVHSGDSTQVQMAGRRAHPCKGEFHQTLTIANDTARLVSDEWLRVSVAGFVPAGQAARSIDEIAKLVVDFSNSEGKLLKYRAINIGTHLGNPRYILWKTRGTGEWGEASFFVRVPKGFDAGSHLKIYIWNPKGQDIYIGDLSVEQWK